MQLKYERYRENVGRYINVPTRHEGGSRFVPVLDSTTLRDLQESAVGLFFSPTNGYGESRDECVVSLVCGTFPSKELDMSCLVKQYLSERCLKIGKTSFILRSLKEDESELPPIPWEQPSAAGSETLDDIVENLPDDPEPPPAIVPSTPGGESTQAR